MKKFYGLIAFFILILNCGAKEIPQLRIIDATGGAPLEVFVMAALELSSQGKMNISMQRDLPSKALASLDRQAADAVICEVRFAASRPQIPLAAEALALYVSNVNPVKNLTSAQALEILTAARPDWKPYNRLAMDIQRAALRNDLPGGRLLRRVFGNKKFDREIFSVRSQHSGYAFANSASLFYAPYFPLPPSTVKMVAVNGVNPTLQTVKNGKYPLALRYAVVTSGKNVNADELLKFIASKPQYRQQMQDAGLIVLLP